MNIYMVKGKPLCGKTTLINHLVSSGIADHCCFDYPESIDRGMRTQQRLAVETNRLTMVKKLAKKHGYRVIVISFLS